MVFGLAFTAIATFQSLVVAVNHDNVFREEWNHKEAMCLQNPSCDLEKFDRERLVSAMESNHPRAPVTGMAMVGPSVILLFVSLWLIHRAEQTRKDANVQQGEECHCDT